MIKRLALYLFGLLHFTGLSQVTGVDSLYNLLRNRVHDSVYLKLHNNIADRFLEKNNDSAIFHYRISLKKSLANSDHKNTVVNFYDLGSIHVRLGNVDTAITYYTRGLAYLKENNKPGYIDLMSGLGNAWFIKGNFIKAYEYFLNYLKEAERSGTPKQTARASSNVGAMLKEQNKFDEAIPYFRRAIELYESIEDKKGYYVATINMANAYYEKSKRIRNDSLKQVALGYYNMARPISEYKDDYRMRMASVTLLCNLGNIYADLKNFEQSKKEYLGAVTLMEGDEYFPQAALVYNNLAGLYVDMGDLTNAREALKNADLHTKESDSPDNYAQLYNVYARYFELSGDYKKAYDYHRLYKKFSDSLFNTDNAEKRKELELNYEFDKKEATAKAEQEKKEAVAELEKKRQRLILYSVIAGFSLMVLLSVFIYRGYRNKKKANEIITLQKEEVEKAKHIIEKQKELVEEKQKEILDSIHYAKRIQDALFSGETLLENYFNGNDRFFIFFRPKDIVSGDFYWATEHGDHFFLAVCDSTGHGVPGAFMSLLNIGFISEAINEHNIIEPNLVLDYVRSRLINSISKEGQKDGFDGILLRIDKTSGEICYSAAHNKPILVTNGEFTDLPCDKMPVGKGERQQNFSLHTVTQRNAMLYLSTDGFADQFGGDQGKKFKYKPFYQLLAQHADTAPSQQKEHLSDRFEAWKGRLEQVDDVLVVGIKI